jgi:hypothetical protein
VGGVTLLTSRQFKGREDCREVLEGTRAVAIFAVALAVGAGSATADSAPFYAR